MAEAVGGMGEPTIRGENQAWLKKVGVTTLYIEPGSPWENGYIESFNEKLRDERLTGEILEMLLEAKVLIERWRVEYNTVRPHSVLGSRRSVAGPASQGAIRNIAVGTASGAGQ